MVYSFNGERLFVEAIVLHSFHSVAGRPISLISCDFTWCGRNIRWAEWADSPAANLRFASVQGERAGRIGRIVSNQKTSSPRPHPNGLPMPSSAPQLLPASRIIAHPLIPHSRAHPHTSVAERAFHSRIWLFSRSCDHFITARRPKSSLMGDVDLLEARIYCRSGKPYSFC